MPTLKQVIEFRELVGDKSIGVIGKKSHDYAGATDELVDIFSNLRLSTYMGVTNSTAQSIFVRACDKFMRLANLTKPGVTPMVENESVIDTLMDFHNYIDYMVISWLEQSGRLESTIQSMWEDASLDAIAPSQEVMKTTTPSSDVKRPYIFREVESGG